MAVSSSEQVCPHRRHVCAHTLQCAGRHDDDVADPIGRPRRVYERCAAKIEELAGALVDLAWPVGVPAVPSPRA